MPATDVQTLALIALAFSETVPVRTLEILGGEHHRMNPPKVRTVK